MKYLLILSALLFWSTVQSQIVLEQTYSINTGKQLYLINLGNEDYKYFMFDPNNNSFDLYNLDHSPFMLNVQTPVDLEDGIFVVCYVSWDLFDCDSTTLEYVITAPTEGNRPFYVYRTDGSLFWQKDSVVGPYCYGCLGGSLELTPIKNTPDGAKMMLFNSNGDFFVYALCGELAEVHSEMEQHDLSVEVFPNPSSYSTSFRISLPDNLHAYELSVFNVQMQELKSFRVPSDGKLEIDNSDLPNGTYIYSLKSENRIVHTGKLMIVK